MPVTTRSRKRKQKQAAAAAVAASGAVAPAVVPAVNSQLVEVVVSNAATIRNILAVVGNHEAALQVLKAQQRAEMSAAAKRSRRECRPTKLNQKKRGG